MALLPGDEQDRLVSADGETAHQIGDVSTSAAGDSRFGRSRAGTPLSTAPSDALRDVYERRARLEYSEIAVPDAALDRKFAVVSEQLRRCLPCSSFLDAGCGDGRYLAALPDFGPIPPKIVGTDIADGMLETTARAAARAGIEPELVRANLEQLPLDDGVFDVVLCAQVIEHLLDPDAAIGELARVLTPGGALVLTTDNSRALVTKVLNAPRWTLSRLVGKHRARVAIRFPHTSFSKHDLLRLVESKGLTVVGLRTFRFTVVGAPDWLRRHFNRVDAHLPDLGIGDVLLIVARRPDDTASRL